MKQEEKSQSGRNRDFRFSGTKQGLTEYDFFIAEGGKAKSDNEERDAGEEEGMEKGRRAPYPSRSGFGDDH